VLNGLAVRYFGTAEFYLAMFKVFLMMGLISYTFVTMVGGNPEHWAYGFTYWKSPVSRSQPLRAVLLIILFEGLICRVPRSWKHRTLSRISFLRHSGFLHVGIRYISRFPDSMADGIYHAVWSVPSSSP
jgi:amino acid permease